MAAPSIATCRSSSRISNMIRNGRRSSHWRFHWDGRHAIHPCQERRRQTDRRRGLYFRKCVDRLTPSAPCCLSALSSANSPCVAMGVSWSKTRPTIDPLSGLPNRLAFDNAFSGLRCELPGSWRLSSSISTISNPPTNCSAEMCADPRCWPANRRGIGTRYDVPDR
jgi:hypothetical protein